VTAANVGGTLLGVSFRRELNESSGRTTLHFLFEDLLEEWDAPAAAGTGAATLGKLTGDARVLATAKINQFAPGNVKTVANFGVEVHDKRSSG
jgi:hypothetical protein